MNNVCSNSELWLRLNWTFHSPVIIECWMEGKEAPLSTKHNSCTALIAALDENWNFAFDWHFMLILLCPPLSPIIIIIIINNNSIENYYLNFITWCDLNSNYVNAINIVLFVLFMNCMSLYTQSILIIMICSCFVFKSRWCIILLY